MNRSLKLAIVSLLVVCASQNVAISQDASDFPGLILDLSRTNNSGSARILGLGGAQTAIGGDISSVSSNPAGLGFFNRSEFSFSAQFNGLNTSSDYLNTTVEDSRLNFNIPNLGAVINTAKSKGKWKSQSFGVSLNRTADFQNQVTYEGLNSNYDFIRYAVQQDNLDGFTDLTDLAFEVDLTTTVDFTYNGESEIVIDDQLFPVEDVFGRIPNIGETLELTERNIFDVNTGELGYPNEEFPVQTQENIDVRGASYQFSIAYGANYDDKVYLGGSIGIASFNKEVERLLIERPTETDLNELRLLDEYEQSGIGINGTLGVIIRPIDQILLGASYTTPTYYSASQIQEIELSAFYNTGDIFSEGIIYEDFDYNITTPSRLKGGVTAFLNKSGFITAEVERINYSVANLSLPSDGFSFSEENNTIDRFNNALNYRLGAEFRYQIFRVRGGFAYIEDPVENNLEQDETQFSFGLGIRKRKYYGDLAIVHSDGFANRISPYPGTPQAVVEQNTTRVTLTVGVNF